MGQLTATASIKAWFGRIAFFVSKGSHGTQSSHTSDFRTTTDDMKSGKYIFPNGDIITGDFVDGKRTGQGRYIFSNGHVYHGNFIDGKRTGKGTYRFSDDENYQGDFVN